VIGELFEMSRRIDQLEAERECYRDALRRIGGHAGDPDPLRACQTIVKVVREALESDHTFLRRMNRPSEAKCPKS
jgi:hypothetical protein